MPKYSGINRPYAAGEIEKTPQEKQRELDEKMKQFLAKGGKGEKLKAHKPTKDQLRNYGSHSHDLLARTQCRKNKPYNTIIKYF